LELPGLQLSMGILDVTIPPDGFGLLTVPLKIVHSFEEEIFHGGNVIACLIAFLLHLLTLIVFTTEIIH